MWKQVLQKTVRLAVRTNMYDIKRLLHTRMQYQSKGRQFNNIVLQFFEKEQWRLQDIVDSVADVKLSVANGFSNQHEIALVTNDNCKFDNIKEAAICRRLLLSLVLSLRPWNSSKREQLHDIDKQCCSYLTQMSVQDVLATLTVLAQETYGYVTTTTFYAKAMIKLKEAFESNSLNVHEMVQIIYFTALSKKLYSHNLLKFFQLLPDIEKISLLEKCIISECSYKSGVTLFASQVESITNALNHNMKYLIAHPHLLIALIKGLKFNKVSMIVDIETLSRYIITSDIILNYMSIAHILPLFYYTRYGERVVLKRLATDLITALTTYNQDLKKHNYSLNEMRKEFHPKYLDMALGSLSKLNYQLEPYEVLVIWEFIENTLMWILKNTTNAVNIILSMWIFGHYSEKILNMYVEEKVFSKVAASPVPNIAALSHLLITCIQIEFPKFEIPDELICDVKLEKRVGPKLSTLHTVVKQLACVMELYDIQIGCPIKALPLDGISFTHRSIGKVHIDVLHKSLCLRNTKVPCGFLPLKLRLLKKLGYTSILIDGEHTEDIVSLYMHVESAIKQILNNPLQPRVKDSIFIQTKT